MLSSIQPRFAGVVFYKNQDNEVQVELVAPNSPAGVHAPQVTRPLNADEAVLGTGYTKAAGDKCRSMQPISVPVYASRLTNDYYSQGEQISGSDTNPIENPFCANHKFSKPEERPRDCGECSAIKELERRKENFHQSILGCFRSVLTELGVTDANNLDRLHKKQYTVQSAALQPKVSNG